ncbi:MAG TPA: DUF4147 domain-containing protein [Terracidiphilus sp.]|nr:DUF4147 domain-containing protein [Terracidiphilus sp.]
MTEASLRQIARTIFLNALSDCSVEKAFTEKVKTRGRDTDSVELIFGEHAIDFTGIRHLRIIAAGKAAASMLKALLKRLPPLPDCDAAGVIISPDSSYVPAGFEYYCGGHPFPNTDSFAGARRVLALLEELPQHASRNNTLVIFLISGGASAMMESPLDAKITLDETIAFHRALVHSGASILEINCVRKHFSAVKGGRLGLAAQRVQYLTILLSDVPPGKLDSIASGPTLPDSSNVEQCREILQKYHLLDQFPLSIRDFFASSSLPETVKPGMLNSPVWTILSAEDMAEAARIQAEKLGFPCVIDNAPDDWNYREAAEYLLSRARELRQHQERVCLISAGEIMVRPSPSDSRTAATVFGNGGRNQHFALYAATLLEESDAPLAILSAGSDGIDGHSDAAGAVVSVETLQRTGDKNLEQAELREAANQALAEFHSSTFLEGVGARIVTGPTGNNLRDLRIFIADR